MKVFIVGISGSGKSTLARQIARQRRLPLLHLDSLYWEENWVLAPRTKVDANIQYFIENNSTWIIEGYVNTDLSQVLECSDQIIYLDFGRTRVSFNVLKRWATHFRKKRSELPNGCIERPSFKFMKMVVTRKERPELESTLRPYSHKVTRITNHKQVSNLLATSH
jgi:adenylate kinase family enzyme